MPTAYINRIATAVPPHDVHQPFLRFAELRFRKDSGTLSAFRRMAQRSGTEHRYSCLQLMPDWETGSVLDTDALYTRTKFANTAARMRVFETRAPELATATIERLHIAGERDRITHLVITCCTGFSAPDSIWKSSNDAGCRARPSAPWSGSWDAPPRSTA